MVSEKSLTLMIDARLTYNIIARLTQARFRKRASTPRLANLYASPRKWDTKKKHDENHHASARLGSSEREFTREVSQSSLDSSKLEPTL